MLIVLLLLLNCIGNSDDNATNNIIPQNVFVLVPVFCVIVGVALFGTYRGNWDYPVTTYVIGALCGLVGGIIMCLELTGHAK